jgi:hypothetical protein
MQKINKKDAFQMIMGQHEKIFSAQFIKKDGTFRAMVCRRGVTKGVKGVGMNYDPAAHNLVTVFDMRKNEFRSIPIDRLICFKMDGVKYEVKE